ncbi:MAG TPA: pseudouridine synthase, partial [Candidatus Desulfovibrio intestinigallinarum]|nr:pseudouridine synthase [Candidatus Desulfovibrio intestinigallinarum]
MAYARNILIAVDQLCNTVVGGWPDETLSSRAWRWSRDNVRHWPRICIDVLFFWDRDRTTGRRHCE